jgi:hypothetical protein
VESANHIINENRNDLLNMYKVNDIRVYTHYVVVSSLGILPKTTIQALKDMFMVKGREEVQTENIIAKRYSMADP